jgi:hypothetical protein
MCQVMFHLVKVGRAKVYYLSFNYFTESMAMLGGGAGGTMSAIGVSSRYIPHEASKESTCICNCNCFGIQSEFISFFCETKMYCENI